VAKEQITLSIETSVLEAAKEAAKNDNRSLSNFVEVIIQSALKAK